jgi:ABC-type dipeptide/oligopeptide/nickel transport system permease subunit
MTRRRGDLVLLVAVVGTVLLPSVLPFAPPDRPDLARRRWAPFSEAALAPDPSRPEIRPLLGTDDVGRCVLSRLVHGARLSLAAALGGGFVCLAVGGGAGLWAGWRGGRTDAVLMRVVDACDALPTVALVVLAQAWLRAASGPTAHPGARTAALFAVLGGATWFMTARLVRAKARWLARREFVEAALAAGASTGRVLRRHVLPNLGPVLSAAAATAIPRIVLFEAFLSFLGLGVEPPRVSLGALARQGFDAFSLASPRYSPLVLPCVALCLVGAAAGRLASRLDRTDDLGRAYFLE